MKILNSVRFVLTFICITMVFSACTTTSSPNLGAAPTESPIPSKTPVPKTPTSEKSATPIKETFNSIFFEELDKNGYDKKGVENDSIHGVLDEKTVHYAPEGGVKVGNTYIFSWTDAYYYQNGERQKSVVINYACTKVGGSYYCFSTESNSITVDNSLPSKAFVMNLRKAMQEFSPGDKPLTKLELNSKIPGLAEIFGKIFPAYTGKLQIIDIPSIGKVIPANHIVFVE